MMSEICTETVKELIHDVHSIRIEANSYCNHKDLIQQEPQADSFKQSASIVDYFEKKKKRVSFPNDPIKDYSDPPKKWKPGEYSTADLLEAYCKACDKQKCKPSAKLTQQLKALQDLDGINGEKVNVLNLKNERLDLQQVEALEEVFKRLSFKTVDLDGSYFDGEECASTLFEILDYYDTCEKLIIANNRCLNTLGLQALSRLLRKSICVENLDMRAHTFPDYYQFSYFARGVRLSSCLRVLHLENSNMQGKFLILLLNALRENQYMKELYLSENKLQTNDGMYIGGFLKENKYLEVLDLRTNQLQDIGLSHICSGLSEQSESNGLKTLVLLNNNITINGLSYLSKALIHNQSLVHLNIGQNQVTNEGIFALKEALISNKSLDTLILQKAKLSDEGAIALAEYLAETQTLNRLDLRDNDIRLGGIMALTSSLKFNRTLTRLDIGKELKKDSLIKDYNEQAKRLFQEISEYCARNKTTKVHNQDNSTPLMCPDDSIFASNTNGEFEISSETVFVDKKDFERDDDEDESCQETFNQQQPYHMNTVFVDDTDEFFKAIYTNPIDISTCNTPLAVITEQIVEETENTTNFFDYFDEANGFCHVVESDHKPDAERIQEEQVVDSYQDYHTDDTSCAPGGDTAVGPVDTVVDQYSHFVETSQSNCSDSPEDSLAEKTTTTKKKFVIDDDLETDNVDDASRTNNEDQVASKNCSLKVGPDEEDVKPEKIPKNEIALHTIGDKSTSNESSFEIDVNSSLAAATHQVDIERIVNAQLTINLDSSCQNDPQSDKQFANLTSSPIVNSNRFVENENGLNDNNIEMPNDSTIQQNSIINYNQNTEYNGNNASETAKALVSLDVKTSESDAVDNKSSLITRNDKNTMLDPVCETDDQQGIFKAINKSATLDLANGLLNFQDLNTHLINPFFTSKLTNSQLSEEILNELV